LLRADIVKYTLVEIQAAHVLQKMVSYGYKIFAHKIDDVILIDLTQKTIGEIRNLTSDADYLFFYDKATTTTE